MRKLILIFALMISASAWSQFTVSETKWKEVGRYIQAIKLYENEDKTKAMIHYLDTNTIASRSSVISPTKDYKFEFSTEPDTLDKLYEVIKNGFDEGKEKVLDLEFPEGRMSLNFYYALGGLYMNFKFANESGIYDRNSSMSRDSYGLNMKRVDALFGKTSKKGK